MSPRKSDASDSIDSSFAWNGCEGRNPILVGAVLGAALGMLVLLSFLAKRIYQPASDVPQNRQSALSADVHQAGVFPCPGGSIPLG